MVIFAKIKILKLVALWIQNLKIKSTTQNFPSFRKTEK